jgi:hypothetical protein
MVCNKYVDKKLWEACFLQFQTKNNKILDIQVSYLNNQISNNFNISFLGLKIDNYLTWEDHTDEVVVKQILFCNMIRKIVVIFGYIKNSILLICAFHTKLWNHILGQLTQHKSVQDTKKDN